MGNIAVMAVIARIVSPKDFGVFALAVTVQTILTGVAELGVASVIARSDIAVERIAPTVVTISVGTSAILATAMALFAGPIASFLGSPDAEGPVRILAITIALIGPFAVPGAQLQRDFRQDQLFWGTLVSFAVSNAVLIALALVGDGATAFAWSRVVGQLVVGLYMMWKVERNYGLGFSFVYVKPLLWYGLPVAGANILSQALVNIDYVFVGRMLSTTDVGVYTLAFNICMWSASVIGTMLNAVGLPAFSTVRRDQGDLAAALAHALRSVALVAFPMAGFTCAFAAPLVMVIYGSKWQAASPVLSVLSFYGVAFVAGLLFGGILTSMGRTGPLFAVQAVAVVFLVPALWIGISAAGLIGLGIAHISVICLVTLPIYLRSLRQVVAIRTVTLLAAVGRPAATTMAAVLLALAVAAPLTADLARLMAGGLVGGAVYLGLNRSLFAQLVPVKFGAWAPMKQRSVSPRRQ
ncbi:lipopolysaccharide exporter [Sinomonas sp. RB5]